ncbi:hypothetical protein IRZ71_04725 [Flavobacterium sp. ANB]|uniref:hypothetical protein n=1 Tax=unclassified Flavobacterium TaxID=196869 RepID=UPI0012B98B64|nr:MULTISPECIES: hypothetical protein [unclassified Flavobacterium]MBF4515632.1 hypothetical protein [Flavobacterium sp. ANB]MTD68635.1 hypothetical protein [Flavobacterium sp. LC2016-13]
MKAIKLYITFFLFSTFQILYAHKDKIVQKSYGNIHVVITASDYVEEMNKSLIISKYAELLAKKILYSDKVYLYFLEEQSENFTIKTWMPNLSDNSDNVDGINIMFNMRNYNISGCLQVIENALLNKNILPNFADKQFEIYKREPSKSVLKILQQRINRPNEIIELPKSEVFSYYTQNNQYHFFTIKDATSKDVLVLFNNILDYKVLSSEISIVFTKEDEFNIVKNNSVMKTQHIDNTLNLYWSYKVRLSGENKIFIEFYDPSQQKDRMMIYYLKDETFIQDVDKSLGN